MTTTPTEASRYQQPREHLNYLRLADAATALPAVLDQAKTEKRAAQSSRITSAFRSSSTPARTRGAGKRAGP